MNHHDLRLPDDASDRRDVAEEIEIEFVVERRVDRIRRCAREQRISVGGCPYDGLGGDIGASALPILNNEWLAEPFRKPLPQYSCEGIERAARSKADNDPYRARRIGLRPRDPRQGWQRGSARGQVEEFAAGKVHMPNPLSLNPGLQVPARPVPSGRIGAFCAI